MSVTYTKNLDVKYTVDVFVAGGGPAGVAAAVMAARQGSSVFLAEAYGAFGGAAVTMLIPAFMPFTNGVDFLAGGIGREVHDYIADHCFPAFLPYCPDSIPVETLKLCYDDMITAAGVQFEFFTTMMDVVTDGDAVDYVICTGKSGTYAVKAKIYIDCTGDGDLCARAGAPFEKGDPQNSGEMMAATMCGLWSGIDRDKALPNDARKLEEAFRDGIFTNEDRHLPGIWPITKSIGGSNVGHIYDVDGTDTRSLSRGMLKGRKQLLEYRRYYREYLTGFENMELVITGSCIGIRETRRITGEYILDVKDFENRAGFPDEIGRFSYPVDIHAGKNDAAGYQHYHDNWEKRRYRAGESYGIPYRALVVKNLSNVLVAGRCISTDRYMQSSVRVMPGCYITGQAAGMAAALTVKDSKTLRTVDIAKVQKALKKAGGFLPNCEG